jgi:hypothetical protein
MTVSFLFLIFFPLKPGGFDERATPVPGAARTFGARAAVKPAPSAIPSRSIAATPVAASVGPAVISEVPIVAETAGSGVDAASAHQDEDVLQIAVRRFSSVFCCCVSSHMVQARPSPPGRVAAAAPAGAGPAGGAWAVIDNTDVGNFHSLVPDPAISVRDEHGGNHVTLTGRGFSSVPL